MSQKLNANSMMWDEEEDDLTEDSKTANSSRSDDKGRLLSKENHCEIERRRRNKMTAYLSELSDMVPTCNTLARKPDKLTILRMAVAHIKNLRSGGGTRNPEPAFKPSFLSDDELKHLILEAADGFLFVVNCDSGVISYVSDSVGIVLNCLLSDWEGASIYDRIHPDDIEKVREQLMIESRNLRVLDMKSGTVKKDLGGENRVGIGLKRGFICRMRFGRNQDQSKSRSIQRSSLNLNDQNYAVIHCTGYIKSWANENFHLTTSSGPSLIAIGRLQITTTSFNHVANLSEFITRINIEGNFTFIDQRVTEILGYIPIDLLGNNCFKFIHAEDEGHLKESLKQILTLKGQILSVMARFRSKTNDWVMLRISAYAFLNPYSDQVEYIVCTNTIIKSNPITNYQEAPPQQPQTYPEQFIPSQSFTSNTPQTYNVEESPSNLYNNVAAPNPTGENVSWNAQHENVIAETYQHYENGQTHADNNWMWNSEMKNSQRLGAQPHEEIVPEMMNLLCPEGQVHQYESY
ncbi:aryl hydrocarbon receptor nuclear translocator homolog [Onthophagus taurus]|uniref:aryl hydrocarbon receptor nuclear translocator homolog n=1 Tax=Onthophagus taurus TaxID=166361 RepID=UPI000C204015|nr:aryl hydrocarbon receptor nuclear translocator homolog [Onthophagus taurus]XP_022920036.1 aryl hydrocarbon receptor nuclear translocator homolog [Onthophagus taurus]XP_022920037.1 aryl hydrocarbon receptor nuclear translocator homolog [Onthophagus taurus]